MLIPWVQQRVCAMKITDPPDILTGLTSLGTELITCVMKTMHHLIYKNKVQKITGTQCDSYAFFWLLFKIKTFLLNKKRFF